MEELPIENKEETEKKPLIKHIVCSGGGLAGFIFHGVFKECHLREFWDIANIETMYGTSIGSMIIVMLSLKYSWKDMDDYLIHRPWETVYKINMYSLFEIFTKKGLFDRATIQETLSPLLKGKDLSVDITLQELFEYNHIELHIFTVEINEFEVIDISYKTHPDWKVVDAVYSSCALPILFSPCMKEQQCFYDGGILVDYPLEYCISNGANPDEIFSVVRITRTKIELLNEESTFIDNISTLVYRYMEKFKQKNVVKKGKYTVYVENQQISIQNILFTTTESNERIRLIEYGEQKAREYMESFL
jgi:hypothetical protein